MLGVGLGIVANPWLTTEAERARWCLTIEIFVLATAIGVALWRAYRREQAAAAPASGQDERQAPDWPRTIGCLVIIAGLWLLLYRWRWLQPEIIGDDEHYLRAATDWETTRANLFRPYNEHFVVPTRLITYLCLHLSTAATLPRTMALVAVPLFFLALGLLFSLARREWRSDFAGLLAVALFALTTNDREIIFWYSATQWLIALNLLLGALLLAGTAAHGPSPFRLAGVTLLAYCAPFSYSVGLLVGPISSLWLAVKARGASYGYWLALVVLPTVGTLLGVMTLLPTLLAWTHSDEYRLSGGRGMGTFDLRGGILYSAQLIVDLLFLRNLGIPWIFDETRYGPWGYGAVLLLLALGLIWLLRARPAAWRLTPALGLVVLPYALAMPFRVWVNYWSLTTWTRYQLFPQLGVALVVTGAVCLLCGPERLRGRLTKGQAFLIIVVALSLEVLQFRLARP